MAKEGKQANSKGKGRAKSTAAGKETSEERDDAKEEREDDEDPGEARQQVKVVAGTVVATGKAFRDIGGILVPGGAKRKSWMCLAAVVVVVAANKEVGPLANISCAINARCVGAQEISLVERRAVCDTRKDDEEEEQQRHRHEDEAR